MQESPLKLSTETRVYVRIALRDTLEAYDLSDLLDVMADVCQQNAEAAQVGGRLGLTAEAWQLRADVLRQAADRLDEAGGERPPPEGQNPAGTEAGG
jgi:hypothetical protein